MKTFTIIALCRCGCNRVTAWTIRARDVKSANRRFRRDQDPQWPLKTLAVLEGSVTLHARKAT